MSAIRSKSEDFNSGTIQESTSFVKFIPYRIEIHNGLIAIVNNTVKAVANIFIELANRIYRVWYPYKKITQSIQQIPSISQPIENSSLKTEVKPENESRRWRQKATEMIKELKKIKSQSPEELKQIKNLGLTENQLGSLYVFYLHECIKDFCKINKIDMQKGNNQIGEKFTEPYLKQLNDEFYEKIQTKEGINLINQFKNSVKLSEEADKSLLPNLIGFSTGFASAFLGSFLVGSSVNLAMNGLNYLGSVGGVISKGLHAGACVQRMWTWSNAGKWALSGLKQMQGTTKKITAGIVGGYLVKGLLTAEAAQLSDAKSAVTIQSALVVGDKIARCMQTCSLKALGCVLKEVQDKKTFDGAYNNGRMLGLYIPMVMSVAAVASRLIW